MTSHDEDLVDAARNADLARMQTALSLGADPNVRDRYGATPLIALLRASVRTVQSETTVESKSDHDSTTTSFLMTAVARILTEDERSVVENLLNRGADINARDNTGATALMWAAAFADKPYVALLLDHQADPRVVTDDGASCLSWASGAGKTDVLQTLLDHGCDPNNVRRMDGVTPLMLEACLGSQESVQALINAGADVHIRDSQGKTALDYAHETGNEDTARVLQAVK